MENIDFPNRPHAGHLIKGSCLGASYTKSELVTIGRVDHMKSLVTIGILIVSGKMLHQKRGAYKYVLPLKN